MSYGKIDNKVNLVIDIETIAKPVRQEDIDRAMQEYAPPANYKTAEAIERHKAKFHANIIEDLLKANMFSIGGKRMLSCALGRVDDAKQDVLDIESWISDDLSVVTKGIVEYLDSFREYRLIGWNHIGFDLPEVAKSFKLTGVRPKYKPTRWDLVDLSKHPFHKTKLKDAAVAFGIEISEVNGAAVAEMYAEGRLEEIQKYNELDVFITGHVFLGASTIFSLY